MCALALLAGCAGPTATAKRVTTLDEAARNTAAAELAFLAGSAIVDCQEQFYSATAAWVAGGTGPLDISGACAPRPLAPDALATRQALTRAVLLYADKLATLSAAGGSHPVDTATLLPAQELGALARSSNLRLNNPALYPVVQNGLGAIAEFALSREKDRTARQIARQMQPHLAALVQALQSENFAIGQELAGSMGKIEIVLRGMIARFPRPVTPPQQSDAFFRIVNAETILASSNPLRPETRATPDEASRPSDPAAALNQSWAALLRDNAALTAAP